MAQRRKLYTVSYKVGGKTYKTQVRASSKQQALRAVRGKSISERSAN